MYFDVKTDKVNSEIFKLNIMKSLIIKEDDEGCILVGYSPKGKLILPKGIVVKANSENIDSPENTIFSIQQLSNTNKSIVSLFISEEGRQEQIDMSLEGIERTVYLDIDEIIKQREKFEITHLRMIIRYIRLREGSEFYPQEGRLSNTVEYLYKGHRYSF